MLGLGDIVIPGIFVAIALRYDVAHAAQRARYFYRREQGAERVGPCAGWDAAYAVAVFAWFVPSARKLSGSSLSSARLLPSACLQRVCRLCGGPGGHDCGDERVQGEPMQLPFHAQNGLVCTLRPAILPLALSL